MYSAPTCALALFDFTRIATPFHLYLSVAPINFWNISFAHLAITHRLQVSFASLARSSESPLSPAASMCPLICSAHLLLASILGRGNLCITLTHFAYTSSLHISSADTVYTSRSHISWLSFALQTDLSHAAVAYNSVTLSATPCLNLRFAPLVRNFHLNRSRAVVRFVSVALLSLAFPLHPSSSPLACSIPVSTHRLQFLVASLSYVPRWH